MIRVLKTSLLTIPFSILLFLFMDLLMSSVFGGYATTKGFPVPYYRDVWTTPNIDYSLPVVKYIDIFLIYIISTFIVLKSFRK